MTITAKYASICPCCNVRITPGAKVEWSKGSPARHATCATTRPQSSVVGRYPRERMGAGHGSAVRMPGYSSYCTANSSCRCYDCA